VIYKKQREELERIETLCRCRTNLPPKFKDVIFLNELAMSGETHTGVTYSEDLLSSVLSEPFTFDNVIQIIKT
jgi:hypothetical protein